MAKNKYIHGLTDLGTYSRYMGIENTIGGVGISILHFSFDIETSLESGKIFGRTVNLYTDRYSLFHFHEVSGSIVYRSAHPCCSCGGGYGFHMSGELCVRQSVGSYLHF